MANEKTLLLKRQIETWNGTEKVWQDHMIMRINGTLEARIARERGKQVKRTAGYSNDEEALRRDFGIGLLGETYTVTYGNRLDLLITLVRRRSDVLSRKAGMNKVWRMK